MIALLNVELELKAEKDNAEIRVHTVEDYQAIVDAEWNILYDKLERIHHSGAKVVLSKPHWGCGHPVLCRQGHVLCWPGAGGGSEEDNDGLRRLHPNQCECSVS